MVLHPGARLSLTRRVSTGEGRYGGFMRVIAVVLGLVSAFFVFYTARLLVVTGFLMHTRAGGQGAFIGAVVFPVLALIAGVACVKVWRLGPRSPSRGGG